MPLGVTVEQAMLAVVLSMAVLSVTHWPQAEVKAAAVRPSVFLITEDGQTCVQKPLKVRCRRHSWTGCGSSQDGSSRNMSE